MTDKTSNISAQTPPANHHDSDQGQPADAGTKEVWEKSSDTEQPKAEEPVPEVKADYVPPNGGYGWVCVGSAFGINANTWGINSVRSLPMIESPYFELTVNVDSRTVYS